MLKLSRELQAFYFKENKLDWLGDVSVEIVSDISRCFDLWEELSPKESFFDAWGVRYGFYQVYQHQPYFVVLKKGRQNIALLPLWYQEDRKRYQWFGGWWHDDNKFFVKDWLAAPLLVELCPKPVHLNCVAASTVHNIPKETTRSLFKPDESKYILDISNFKCVEDYLASLKKNERHNLRKAQRRIAKQNPVVVWNRFADFDQLVALSLQRFKEKDQKGYVDLDEDPGWADNRLVLAYKQVINSAGKDYQMKMITVEIGGEIAGVDLVAIFKGCYYCLCCGYNISRFGGLGNYFNLLEIEDAISLGLTKVDFLQNNYAWKDKFFQEVPTYIYEANN